MEKDLGVAVLNHSCGCLTPVGNDNVYHKKNRVRLIAFCSSFFFFFLNNYYK